jgi:hypothetical protein
MVANKPTFEVADIIDKFGYSFNKKHNPNSWVMRNLFNLSICRTAHLGGHKQTCDSCGKSRISYNSCRNRNCPKCQSSKQAFWVEDVSNRIIDTKYFHIVFTVPDVLNEICLIDTRWFYNTLMATSWQTLRTFGYTNYAVESGALAVLHTWGQNLSLHPHVHCLVPAAGSDIAGNIIPITKKGKYIFPVTKMSVDFRSIMMKKIKKQLKDKGDLSDYQHIIDDAWAKPWNVFSQPSFGDAKHVIKYLGLYTHRVAISNNRILNIDNNNVSFHYKDYKQGAKRKVITLSGVEFLRRFCMHILPKQFVKIRYFGILSNRYQKLTAMYRAPKTKVIKEESTQQRMRRLTGFDVYLCPYCKKGEMIDQDEIIPRIRSPAKVLIKPKKLLVV